MWPFDNSVIQIIATILAAIILSIVSRLTIARLVRRLVGGYEYAGRVIGRKHDSKIDEQKREQTLTALFRTAATVAIWTVTIILLLWELRVNIAALATGAGLIGVVVGFGAQNAIRDFLAGIFIIAENQYRVGDIVTLVVSGRDISGVVEDLTIRITKLRDLDGKLHIVRNGSPDVVANHTFEYANVNIDINVSYESDVDLVEKVLNEVGHDLAQDEAWKDCIVEPIQFLRVDGFEESAVRVKALGKVEPSMQWDVAGEFRRRLKKAFDKHHLTVPYPQRIVHQAPRSN